MRECKSMWVGVRGKVGERMRGKGSRGESIVG